MGLLWVQVTREVEMVLCSVGRVKWYMIGLLWELGPFWFTLMGEGRSRVRVGKYGSQLVGIWSFGF